MWTWEVQGFGACVCFLSASARGTPCTGGVLMEYFACPCAMECVAAGNTYPRYTKDADLPRMMCLKKTAYVIGESSHSELAGSAAVLCACAAPGACHERACECTGSKMSGVLGTACMHSGEGMPVA